jgi:hypothetical protein
MAITQVIGVSSFNFVIRLRRTVKKLDAPTGDELPKMVDAEDKGFRAILTIKCYGDSKIETLVVLFLVKPVAMGQKKKNIMVLNCFINV